MRIIPRNLTERNRSFSIHNKHFCLIWKSNDNSFNQAIKELKLNFKVVDMLYLIKTLNVLLKLKKNLKKDQSPLTNLVVHDLETFNKFRVVPYFSCIYKLSEIFGGDNRDMSEKDYKKCLNDCVVFKGNDCINEMLDHVLSFKGEDHKSQ